MKKHDNQPATKGDLNRFAERFATKTDLERFATKIDLEQFAKKTDLDRFATKNDLWAHEAATRKDLLAHAATTKEEFKGVSSRFDRLERVVKNVAVEVAGFKTALGEMRDDFSAAITRMDSRLIDRLDGFMAKTVKVERDEVWLIHRMDKIEDRVTQIEKRAL